MQSIVRVLVGIALVGFAVFAAFFQYPIEYVVVPLLFAGLFIMNPRWIRAKHGDSEIEARFGEDEQDSRLQSDAEDAIDSLRDSRGESGDQLDDRDRDGGAKATER